MKTRLLSVLLSLAFLLPLIGAVPSAIAADNANITQAVSWLESQQQPDGGFAGFGGKTDPGTTADVALSLAAAGVDPNSVTNGEPSMLAHSSMIAYLESQSAVLWNDCRWRRETDSGGSRLG